MKALQIVTSNQFREVKKKVKTTHGSYSTKIGEFTEYRTKNGEFWV